MKIRTLTLSATFATLAASTSALGDYTGVSVERFTTVSVGPQSYDVFRVYVNFNNVGDRLVLVGGSNQMGPLTIQTRNSNDTGVGSALFNPVASNTAPSNETIAVNPAAQWDSFVTLGASISNQADPYGDQTFLTPGFPSISGTQVNMPNAAWYTTPTFDHDGQPGTPPIAPPQSEAGWQGDGDAATRVLMMQLTVLAGENVRGTVNLAWYHPLGGPFGGVEQQVSFAPFNSFIVPAPAALALLGVAGLVASRRRRA